MNYSFEYIDIILLAMIAGFIFIRLRGILGKKTGHEDDIPSNFSHDFEFKKKDIKKQVYEFDDDAKKEFLKGAKVAYETIITSFANGKIINIKSLLNKTSLTTNVKIDDLGRNCYFSDSLRKVNMRDAMLTNCHSFS